MTACCLCHRSTDYGMTFTNDSYKLNDSSAVISWYYVSPYDQYVSSRSRLLTRFLACSDIFFRVLV